jgi:hypothetical protein
MPVAMPVPSTVLLGTYSGSFTGAENGIFNVAITRNGAVVGGGQSSTNSTRFNITGSIDASGVLSMTATGAAGAAVFSGNIDQATGKVSGEWHYSNNQPGGTFSGQRM